MTNASPVETLDHGNVRELRMSRPPVNAMDPGLVEALETAVRDSGDADGIVISGQPGMFSAGLDVPTLLQLDREGMKAFWNGYFGLLECVARSETPVAMAITGHSPAGGAVLSLFGDTRFMSRGDYKIGLNETMVGLVIPEPIQGAFRRLVGNHVAERMMVAGALVSPEKALAVGMVDELADDPESTIRAAIAWCEAHAALPRHAMLGNRVANRRSLIGLFEDSDNLGVDDFVDGWFSEPVQTTLHALVARLKKKD